MYQINKQSFHDGRVYCHLCFHWKGLFDLQGSDPDLMLGARVVYEWNVIVYEWNVIVYEWNVIVYGTERLQPIEGVSSHGGIKPSSCQLF